MRILITGATGFLGAHVAALARGDVITDRVDLLDPRQAELLIVRTRPTHLIHLAWFVEPAAYWTSPRNDEWAAASAHLFRAFAKHGGERFVGIGTSAEYDWTTGGALREGVTPLAPATPYGASKKRLGEEAAAICRELGISGAWARLFQIYGPGEPAARFVPAVIRAHLRGGTVRCEDPVARDFLYVRDAAAALLSLLESEVEGAVNIGAGVAVRLRDIADHLGVAVEVVPPSSVPLVVADVTRLRDEVGFVPEVTLETGLRQSMEWWRGRLS